MPKAGPAVRCRRELRCGLCCGAEERSGVGCAVRRRGGGARGAKEEGLCRRCGAEGLCWRCGVQEGLRCGLCCGAEGQVVHAG